MKFLLRICPFLLIIASSSAYCLVKDTSKVSQLKKDFEEQLVQRMDATAASLKKQTEALANEQFTTMIAREKQNQLMIQDEQFDMQHRHRSFDFQYVASIVIFIVVILIVLVGLIFSGIQFGFTLRQMQLHGKLLDTVKDPDRAGVSEQLRTELEFSKDGVKVNSSVLGVIVLVFSVAFFYFYLIYVYPIKYITPQDAAKITGTEQVTTKDTTASAKPFTKPGKP